MPANINLLPTEKMKFFSTYSMYKSDYQ